MAMADDSGDFGDGGFGDGGFGAASSGTGADGGGDVGNGGGGIFSGFDPNQPPPLISSEDVLTRGRALATQGVPLQISNLFEALAQLRARAAGSTAEILPSIIGQLSQMRSQYSGASQAIARRLGFAGGGQTEREQGRALAGATRQYGGLITGHQQTSYANLINQLSALQPQLSGAARPPLVRTQEGPQPNLALQGAGIASMIRTARQIQDFYANRQGGAYGGLSQGFNQTAIPYDYGLDL